MIIYPAIDIRGGRCVRLTEGRFDAETVFADDPGREYSARQNGKALKPDTSTFPWFCGSCYKM